MNKNSTEKQHMPEEFPAVMLEGQSTTQQHNSAKTDGYTLAAEWQPQAQVLLTWPHQHTGWHEFTELEQEYLAIAQAIIQFEPLTILCYDADHQHHVKKLLQRAKLPTTGDLRCLTIATNDVWIRDYGPLTVHDKLQQPLHLDFEFNAWGGKYDFSKDNQVTHQLALHGAIDRNRTEKINFILEGGSIDINAQGQLLTTTRCLGAHTRNANLSRHELEHYLEKYLGAQQVLWLEEGALAGDDTDSHIDMLARFTEHDAIMYTSCHDRSDPNYADLQAMQINLRQLCQQHQLPHALIELPIPTPIYKKDGSRLPASYANFLIINDAVLVPTYNDKNADAYACGQIQMAFPHRKIIPLSSRHLIEQFGSIHCATMQISAPLK